ncbi:amino acid ABC transporter permease [Catenibacterium sp. AM22-15]|uniref:amino acid ABC transporter permease n=1 Tax=unclassified Catenibacterium TaxID=2643636 RepID=UPI000E3F7223|nr:MULTISPECIES: amino acid ABC transporter permease [unclassified Catenibacterium]RGE92807.1 amino acid ABC transporter permease [Catenibacterium sp. AM22-6LB]RGF01960.1 amino acid ABC transporter permease [Catenibacterium sp. AM22-15]
MKGFFENLGFFASRFNQAIVITIELSIISLVAATIIGIIVGLVNTSKSKSVIMKILKSIANLYIYIIRGTPMLVQILIIYFGLGQMLRPTGFRWLNIGGTFTAGTVALSLNAGAYMAEIVRGGIEAVDKGQIEAARSLGLTYGKTMKKIVLPQALRTMLPSIINQFIISIKDTSLLSVIGLTELTNVGKTIAATQSAHMMVIYCFMACYYLLICTVLAQVSKVVEKRLSYGK